MTIEHFKGPYEKNSSWTAFKVRQVIQIAGHAFLGTSDGFYRIRKWELQLLELCSWLLQSQGAGGEDGERPQQPATAILLPPHMGSVQLLHVYVSCLRMPKKGRKESKIERTKRKRDTAPVLLRLQDLSVSMQKNSFLCTINRGKAHSGVFAVKGTFLMWNADSQGEKMTFCFKTKYLSSQLILILHLDSKLNSWD